MARTTRLSPFQQLLLDSVLDEYATLPAKHMADSDFSPGFLLKMDKLIRKTHHQSWYLVNSTVKKIILVAVILGLLSMTAFAVPAIREAIIDFFLHQHEDRYGITFDPEEAANAPNEIEIIYSPTLLPEGFSLRTQEKAANQVTYLWVDPSGNYVIFDQCIIPSNATSDNWIGIDASHSTLETTVLFEYQVTIVFQHDYTILFWTDNDYLFSLHVPGWFSRDLWESIFRSVQPK